MRGIVAFFSSGKGYGFIECVDEGKDFFVHHTQIRGMVGFRTLRQGERVTFDVGVDEKTGKTVAQNVFPIDILKEDSDGI